MDEVKNPDEKTGTKISGGFLRFTLGMQEFKDFVASSELTEIRFSGHFLTWWDNNKTHPVQRNLDRAMINTAWLHSFSLSHARFLPRGLSDHSSILVEMGTPKDNLRKPFQVFNHVLKNLVFLKVVSNAWNVHVSGDPWFVVTCKLKRVKLALIKLNKEGGNLQDAVFIAQSSLLQFQDNLPAVPSQSQF